MYRVRFLFLMLRCLFKRPRGLLDSYELNFRALPFFDTDVTRLFTQAYAAYMGLARWNYVFSSPLKKVALKNAWVPVTTREMITYRRSIKVGAKITLKTQLLCWDDRRFFLKQNFFSGSEEVAVAFVEGLLRGPEQCQS